MKYIILIPYALFSMAHAMASTVNEDTIVARSGPHEMAIANSELMATCGDMHLEIKNAYGDSFPRSKPSATLNGRPINFPLILEMQIGSTKKFYKYAFFCDKIAGRINVQYNVISNWVGQVELRVGSFTVQHGGGVIFHDEEAVAPENFWIG